MESEGQALSVEQYISIMFTKLPLQDIASIFDAPTESLDQDFLWVTFRDIANREILSRSAGDVSVFSVYDEAVNLQKAILDQWPKSYYLEKLAEAGIVHRFETDDPNVYTYAVKESYIPVLNTILMEVDTKSSQ